MMTMMMIRENAMEEKEGVCLSSFSSSSVKKRRQGEVSRWLFSSPIMLCHSAECRRRLCCPPPTNHPSQPHHVCSPTSPPKLMYKVVEISAATTIILNVCLKGHRVIVTCKESKRHLESRQAAAKERRKLRRVG